MGLTHGLDVHGSDRDGATAGGRTAPRTDRTILGAAYADSVKSRHGVLFGAQF